MHREIHFGATGCLLPANLPFPVSRFDEISSLFLTCIKTFVAVGAAATTTNAPRVLMISFCPFEEGSAQSNASTCNPIQAVSSSSLTQIRLRSFTWIAPCRLRAIYHPTISPLTVCPSGDWMRAPSSTAAFNSIDRVWTQGGENVAFSRN